MDDYQKFEMNSIDSNLPYRTGCLTNLALAFLVTFGILALAAGCMSMFG